MAETTTMRVSCHCGASAHAFTIPISALPLQTNLCSCNISRRISGSLLTSYINITHDPDAQKPNLQPLSPYHSSSILTRWFCTTCGTHMFLEYHSDGHFEAATGTLQVETTDGTINFNSQMWIEDTLDGGASQFITHIAGNELKRYSQEAGQSDELPLQWQASTSTMEKGAIRSHCHCRGVDFWIQRPNEESRKASSPFPDLLIPSHTAASENPKNEAWWLPDSSHYLAGTCTCNSCRRMLGFDVTFWAFVPVCNIYLDEDCTIPFRRHPYWGSMKSYRSSEGVTRTFCSTCGANVFWDGEWRDSIVDVAVGLLDASSGSRAEEILAWWPGRVSFTEQAMNREYVRGLEDGLKRWAKENGNRACVAKGRFPR